MNEPVQPPSGPRSTERSGARQRSTSTTNSPAASASSSASSGQPRIAMPADPPNVSDAQTMRPGSSGSESSGPGIVDRVRERAGAQLTSQKDRATDGIGTIAQAVRKTTQELRNDKHDGMADYVERAADQLDRLSAHLKGKDVGELFREAGDLARRKPVVFVGSAFVIGLLGARFLKSSRQGSAPAHPAWQRRGNNPGAEPLYRASSSYEADASRYRSGRIPSADVENL